jgi:hypothetical protein
MIITPEQQTQAVTVEGDSRDMIMLLIKGIKSVE